MGILGVVVILGALIYIARPVGHVPPFDANLVRLAETELEGYCAGQTLWRSQRISGDAEMAHACRDQERDTYSSDVDLRAVVPAFCRGIVEAGFPASHQDCLGIMDSQQYWPTYDGGVSNQWNRARPYPLNQLQVGEVEQDNSRTGERVENTRNLPAGPVAPNTTTTEESEEE